MHLHRLQGTTATGGAGFICSCYNIHLAPLRRGQMQLQRTGIEKHVPPRGAARAQRSFRSVNFTVF